MKQKAAVFVLFLLLTSMFLLTFITQHVKAEPITIYIRADGSIDPPTAPVRRDGNTYTFTSDIYGFIVVEKDNIVIDGAGYTLQGGIGTGIDLTGRTNVVIRNIQIRNFEYEGIHLYHSSNIRIVGNYIANNRRGIFLEYSSSCIITENYIINNRYNGIELLCSSNNFIYHNNFIDNGYETIFGVKIYGCGQVYSDESKNVWDNGYPSGGNYWSDYNGKDANGDGIGDTPYTIDENNIDHYPLMKPFYYITVSIEGLPSSYAVSVYIDENNVGYIQGGDSKTFRVDKERVKVRVEPSEIKTNDTIYKDMNDTLTVNSGEEAVFRYYAEYYVEVISNLAPTYGSGWYHS